MGGITVLGVGRVQRKIAKMGRLARVALRQGLREEGEIIMSRSKSEFVPVDQGNLKGSGIVRTATKGPNVSDVILSFGGPSAPYALAVHEIPPKGGGRSQAGGQALVSGQIGGENVGNAATRTADHKTGSWKYLEIPALEARAGMPSRLAGRVRLALKVR